MVKHIQGDVALYGAWVELEGVYHPKTCEESMLARCLTIEVYIREVKSVFSQCSVTLKNNDHVREFKLGISPKIDVLAR